jgi:hypothetical protein
MLIDLLASSGLGTLVGMRHALEPDHLAAVTTLVSREPAGARAAWIGMAWGAGHTLALVAAGVVLAWTRSQMPATASAGFELLVAFMLVALGVRAVLQAARQGPRGPSVAHRHGGVVHRHAGAPAHVHVGAWTLARRPLLVGIVHGMAGSGALTALVMTTLPSVAGRIAYVVLFGLGSTVSMAAMSGVLGWPLARLGAHHALVRGITLVVGLASTALGVAWGSAAIAQL